MGAKLNGLRSLKHLNDNLPKAKRGLDEVPIKPEDWRHAPRIEVEPGARWYCLSTVPQNEYRCLDDLASAGVLAYVPTETRWVKRRKGKDLLRTQVQSPIWRGYVFCRIAQECDWAPVYARDAFGRSRAGVIGVIGAHGAPVAIYAGKLGAMADEEREGWFDDRRRPSLIAGRDAKPAPVVMAGEVVRITDGAFATYEGVAENDNDRDTVRISVDLFGQATLMTIPLDALENLSRQSADLSLRRA